MDTQQAVSITEAFQHGFSAGAAFVIFVFGAYLLLTRRRNDP